MFGSKPEVEPTRLNKIERNKKIPFILDPPLFCNKISYSIFNREIDVKHVQINAIRIYIKIFKYQTGYKFITFCLEVFAHS